MAQIRASLNQQYSIFEDGWTETLVGIKYLIEQTEDLEQSGDSFHSVIMLRVVIILSSFLAEPVFNKSVNTFIDNKLNFTGQNPENTQEQEDLLKWRKLNSLKTTGISRAMKEWPKQLTGKPLNLGKGSLQALKIITDKRNDLVHKIDDLTLYSNHSLLAKQVLFSAIEGCKDIEKHFIDDKPFSYQEWLDTYPVENKGLLKNFQNLQL